MPLHFSWPFHRDPKRTAVVSGIEFGLKARRRKQEKHLSSLYLFGPSWVYVDQ